MTALARSTSASLQDGAAPTAADLPLAFGQRPPADPAARCTAAQAQVAEALEVLEAQRQLKLALAAAAAASDAERCLLAAEAAADLQAQALLAHWATQLAGDAQQLCA